MKCNEWLKLTQLISGLCVIGGFICAIIGVEKIPQNIQYSSDNPMPSDPQLAAAQLQNLKLHSFGFLLVIIGSSFIGGCLIIIFSIFFALQYCACVYYDIPDKRKLSARVHFSDEISVSIPISKEGVEREDVCVNIQTKVVPDLNNSDVRFSKQYDEATKKKIRQWLGSSSVYLIDR